MNLYGPEPIQLNIQFDPNNAGPLYFLVCLTLGIVIPGALRHPGVCKSYGARVLRHPGVCKSYGARVHTLKPAESQVRADTREPAKSKVRRCVLPSALPSAWEHALIWSPKCADTCLSLQNPRSWALQLQVPGWTVGDRRNSQSAGAAPLLGGVSDAGWVLLVFACQAGRPQALSSGCLPRYTHTFARLHSTYKSCTLASARAQWNTDWPRLRAFDGRCPHLCMLAFVHWLVRART